REGRVVVAERDFKGALELDRKLFGETTPTALATLRFGRFYADQQLYPVAVTEFREALSIISKYPLERSEVVSEQIIPFIGAAVALSEEPTQQDTLATEAFEASQIVNSDMASKTVSLVAAREAAGNPALSELIRQAQ